MTWSLVLRPVWGAMIALGLHTGYRYLSGEVLWGHQLLAAYLANVLLAISILVLLLKAPDRFRGVLGFLFLAGSLLKFAVYFTFFYPVYKADDLLTRPEFFSFFIPYAVCLLFETQVLTIVLSRRDQ